MCFSKLFKPKTETELAMPHPEEPMLYDVDLDNKNAIPIVLNWLQEWQVPQEHHYFWLVDCDIALDSTVNVAYSASEIMKIRIHPQYANPGVLAHEAAHVSYSLLTDDEKASFSAIYNEERLSNKYIKLLYSINDYGLTNDIEGHAEVYRYLGEQMPDVLKIYYSKLF